MVGILIVAHGTLGESLLHCASHVMGGRPPQLMQIGVSIHDDPAMILPQARELLRQLDEGTGVLVLTGGVTGPGGTSTIFTLALNGTPIFCSGSRSASAISWLLWCRFSFAARFTWMSP